MSQKILTTPRLKLLKKIQNEEELLFPFFADPSVMRYIRDGSTSAPDQVRESLKKHQNHWDAFGHGFLTIFDKETGEFMGRCGLIHLAMQHDNPEVELGYLLYEKFWGKGYATEVAQELLRWGLEELELPSIIGAVRKENKASQNVLKKIGMVPLREGIYPGTEVVCNYYQVDEKRAILS
ncbi:MAG: GNAT family N-acetyltransferase [Simkaniaceae bacterium]|nr:GNAT family N-acetyltransferase [Candidatus Sacchlamyda saccharinae]